MTAFPSLSPSFHNSNGDEFVLTSFWLSHYLLSQLLFLRHSVFDLQPSANRRRGGGVGRGRWPMGGACRLCFSAPWTAPRLLPLDCREATQKTGRFFKKILSLQTHQSTATRCSPCLLPCFLLHGGVVFFSDPSVESSRLLTALFLRLQVDFYPPPPPHPCFSPVSRKQHAVKVQSGLTASKKPRLSSQIMSGRRIAL